MDDIQIEDTALKFDLNTARAYRLINFTSVGNASVDNQLEIEMYDSSGLMDYVIYTEGTAGSKKGIIKVTAHSPSVITSPPTSLLYNGLYDTFIYNSSDFQTVEINNLSLTAVDSSNLTYNSTYSSRVGLNVESAIDNLVTGLGYSLGFGCAAFNPVNSNAYHLGQMYSLQATNNVNAIDSMYFSAPRSGRVNYFHLSWSRSSVTPTSGGLILIQIYKKDKTGTVTSNIIKSSFNGISSDQYGSYFGPYFNMIVLNDFTPFFVAEGEQLSVVLFFTGYTTPPTSLALSGHLFIDTSYQS